MARKVVTILMVIVILLGSLPSVLAAKFYVNETVEVYNTGSSGLIVRDAPAGNIIGKKYDGNRGTVLAGPQSASLGGVVYTWWKVRWASDGLEGWSAENWLMKVLPDLTIESSTEIWILPTLFYPGDTVTIYVRIKNIGAGTAISSQGVGIRALFDSSFFHQDAMEGLGSGYTYTFQWNHVWPSNTNTHTIQVTVDPSNYIAELNEYNNVQSRSFAASPPPTNQPFTLSNGYVSPPSGDTSTTFSYYVTYSDLEGDDPTTKYVYVDGSPRVMTMVSGSYVTGAIFRYSTTLSAGSHNYYFYFADSDHSHVVRLPTTGTYPGPTFPPPPEPRTLTVYSSPIGVTFTANGVAHSTPWTGTYNQGTSVSLVMSSPYADGDARYYWDKWSDGVPDLSRTVILNSDTTVTGVYIGPYYELIVDSSPISGIPFTLGGAPKTTIFSDWLYQGYYTIEMPAIYNEYTWQKWLEDGSTNRIRTVLLTTSTLLTGVFSLPGPGYEPRLAVPVYAPIHQTAYVGTTIAFVFKVTNDGAATDTIALSVSETYAWDFQLSESSVTLGPHQSTQAFLYLTIGDNPLNMVTIKGTSQGDPSKTSSCQVNAEPFSKGQGLLNIWLKFSNKDSQPHSLIFHAPGQHYTVPLPSYVRLSSDTMTLNPSQQASLYVFFDLSSSEFGLNSFSIGVTGIPSEDSISIPIKFDRYEIATTDFGLTEDSYSFPNGVYPINTCYGMAATSILYSKNPLLLYQKYGKLTTMKVTQDEARGEVLRYQCDSANFYMGVDLHLPGSPNKEAYEELEENIHKNNPMLLGLFFGVFKGHAVVAYGIVKEGNKAYILIYDNEVPYSTLAEISAFKYATYDLTTYKLIYLNSECEFVVHEPKENIASLPLPEGLSQGGQWGHWMKSRVTIILSCPVNVTIADQYGRVISDNGTCQIPDATFALVNETKYFCLPLDSAYNVSIVAYDVGNFTLVVVRPLVNGNGKIDVYEDVVVDSGAEVILEIMPYQTSQMMKLDMDGDGVIDEWRNSSIGEAIYIPLLSYSYSVVCEEEAFSVSVDSNSTVSSFAFDQLTKEISFDVTGLAGTIGLCNVTVPKTPLDEPWIVLLDGASLPVTITKNATHSFLHFTYAHSTHEIKILGTWVIGPPQPPLSCFIDPLSASIFVGHSVTFTSLASGGVSPYAYQWFINNVPVSGATSDTWTFTPSLIGTYYVHLIVTDADSITFQSETARVTVTTTTVGGHSIAISSPARVEPVLPYAVLLLALTATFATLKPRMNRRRRTLKSPS